MKYSASAGRSKHDVRDHCVRLDLRAETEHDTEFLTKLYAHIREHKTKVIFRAVKESK